MMMLTVRMVAYTAVRPMDDGDERINGENFFQYIFIFSFFFCFFKGEKLESRTGYWGK